jgi:hypothetical protein
MSEPLTLQERLRRHRTLKGLPISRKEILEIFKDWLKEQDPEATAWALRNKIITEE